MQGDSAHGAIANAVPFADSDLADFVERERSGATAEQPRGHTLEWWTLMAAGFVTGIVAGTALLR